MRAAHARGRASLSDISSQATLSFPSLGGRLSTCLASKQGPRNTRRQPVPMQRNGWGHPFTLSSSSFSSVAPSHRPHDPLPRLSLASPAAPAQLRGTRAPRLTGRPRIPSAEPGVEGQVHRTSTRPKTRGRLPRRPPEFTRQSRS